ncbi:hypothetical protein F170042I7_23260 [Blautia caecimuris]|jgi:hypothetical protein
MENNSSVIDLECVFSYNKCKTINEEIPDFNTENKRTPKIAGTDLSMIRG